MSKKFLTAAILTSLISGSVTASDDFKDAYNISAAGGITTIVGGVATTIANPGMVAAGAISYTKFVLIYTPVALVVLTSVNLYDKYKQKKMARAQAQTLIMRGGSLSDMPQNLRSTIDDLRSDIRSIVAEKNLSPEVLERVNSTENFDEELNNDAYLITLLANI